MPVYEYKALNKKGKNVSGLIDAENIRNATIKLRNSNIFPASMSEIDLGTDKQKTGITFFQSKISISEIAMMTRQLATLISSGFPLTKALNTMLPQVKKESFRRILSKIKDSIEEGNSFAGSLALYPGTFSNIYINMVKAGESSGTLDIVLERLADISEKQYKLNNKLKSAMVYPLLMTLIGTAVLFFLLTVIVPNITSIFQDMNHSLPMITQILINLSSFFQQWWILICCFIVLLFLFYNVIKKKITVLTVIDKLLLKLPVFGDLVLKISVARLTMTLGSLLENGVALLDALQIVQNVTGNKTIENALIEVIKEVDRGNELGDAMAQTKQFPYLVIQMINVGEQSGNLDLMLKKIAKVYDDDVETKIMSMTSFIEPLIIMVMAVVVGFIVLSICLPIFEMNQLIK